MAESTKSRPIRDGNFWDVNPNACQTNDNNFGGRSVWYHRHNILRLKDKVRVGDRLEFVSSNLPCAHWGIYTYLDELNLSSENVVHFIPGKEEGRAYSNMKTSLGVSFLTDDALVVNSIFKFVLSLGFNVRINNLKDNFCPPVSPGHIHQEVTNQLRESWHNKSQVESVYVCRMWFKDSEDFVNYCRYDHRHYMCRVNCEKITDWYSKADIKDFIREVCVGDRLEFKRHSSYDKRWGIYIGQWGKDLEQVVHFAPGDGNKETNSATISSSIVSSARPKPQLCVESIGKVLGDDIGRIDNTGDRLMKPLVPDHILAEIRCQLNSKKHTFKDSKDFVNYCRYDKHLEHSWRNMELVSDWYDDYMLMHQLRVGDRLEFKCTTLPHNVVHWGIYVSQWGHDFDQVVHFAPLTNMELKTSSKKTVAESGSSMKDKPRINHFQKVLGNDIVRINNERDRIWPPLTRADILDEIELQLPGKTLRKACKVSFKDSEDFVNYCRYDNLRINFGLVSDWCFSPSLPRLRVGDRLEFNATGRPSIKHWGIYIGDWWGEHHQVVHLDPADENRKSSGSSAEDKAVLCTNNIWNVLGSGTKVRINNEGDRTWPPLLKPDILDEINRQLPDERQKHTCEVPFKDSEGFVNYCRYDDWRMDFGLVSDWCDNPSLVPQLHVGDRLEFNRTLPYAHWGIYVGDWGADHDQVLHFAPADGNGKLFSKMKLSGIGSSAKDKPRLCVNSIWEVCGKDKFRINNERDRDWQPLVRANILDEIKRQLISESDGDTPVYHVFRNNCEHFVNHCRYGRHRSDQVRFFPRIRHRKKRALHPPE